MRRNTLLLFRAPQVTYVYVRSYRGTHSASSCSHLRRFSRSNGRRKSRTTLRAPQVTYVYVRSYRAKPRVLCKSATLLRSPDEPYISLCTLLSGYPRLPRFARISAVFPVSTGGVIFIKNHKALLCIVLKIKGVPLWAFSENFSAR